ncbi:MAG: ABC-2 family transporter protein [Planctomycetes bacterium]|nr:ABC-2 family transporter protein [Planctomycetota bacterium]
MSSLRAYFSLMSASLRSQMEYRRAFLLEFTGRFIITGLELAALFIIFENVGNVLDWTRWEVVYLYGIVNVTFGCAEIIGYGLEATVPTLIRTGDFDRVMLQPISPWLFSCGRQFRLLDLGRIAQGLLALGLAFAHLPIQWTLAAVAMFVLTLICNVAVYTGLFTCAAASCFWTTESTEVFNAFTYGGTQMAQFPVHVYRPWLRAIFLWIVPVGFVTYFPALVVLSKPDALGLPPFMPWLSPFIAAVFCGLCALFWRAGLNHYQSTGS